MACGARGPAAQQPESSALPSASSGTAAADASSTADAASADGPAARRLAAWLSVMNSGDHEAIRAYLVANAPKFVDGLDFLLEVQRQSGGLDLRASESATATEVGEELAYDLQSLHRAKVVGEATAGGAHTSDPHVLDAQFRIAVPGEIAINPVTKKNWEGVGVVPDIAVPADAALEEAHRRALAQLASHEPAGAGHR